MQTRRESRIGRLAAGQLEPDAPPARLQPRPGLAPQKSGQPEFESLSLDEALARIDNPLGQDILRQLWQAIPQTMRPGWHPPTEIDSTVLRARARAQERQLTPYQRELRAALENSSLLVMIASGPASLPDLGQALREPLASIYPAVRPRSRRQLLRHLLSSLNWYLWPTRGLPLQQQLELSLGPLLIAGSLLVLAASALAGAGDVTRGFLSGLLPLMLIYGAGLKILLGGLERRWIHARELYEYTCRELGAARRLPDSANPADEILDLDSDPEALTRGLVPHAPVSLGHGPGWH